MSHQQPVALLWTVVFLMLVLMGMPVWVVAEESQKERGLEAVNPDTIMRIGEQGPDKKGPPIEVFVQRDISMINPALSPNGQYLATTAGSSIMLWDVKTGREIRRFFTSNKQYGTLLFDSNSRQIIVENYKAAYENNLTEIIIYNINISTPIAIYSAALGRVTALAISSDNRYLFSGHSNMVAIWDLKTGKIKRTIKCNGIVFAFSPKNKYAIYAPSYGNTLESSTTNIENSIHLIDLSTGKELQQFIGHTQPITTANFNDDESILLSASRDGTLRIWNVETGKTIKVINITQPTTTMMSSVGIGVDGVDSAILSPDGQCIIANYNACPDSGYCKSTTYVLDRISGNKILQVQNGIKPIFFFLDSKRFFGILPELGIHLSRDS